MSPATRAAPRRTVTRDSGPWLGVIDAVDPFENSDQYLYDAVNMYVADPQRGSAAYQRPGFACLNPSAALGVTHQGQCVYEHVDLDGTIRRFLFVGGKVYRWNGSIPAATFTDVTPVGPTIAANVPIYCTSLNGQLIVNDGVNKPWVGTNTGGTPITGTNIEYDSTPHAWFAYGQPDVVGAKAFFIADTLNAVQLRSQILWSEEVAPATGYFQSGFDNQWELSQTSTDPIFRLVGDNNGFTYFRASSIGRVDGTVDKAFRNSATHDSIATDIGSNAPGGVITSPSGIWFSDLHGRVYRLPPGAPPIDIWKQLRRVTQTFIGGTSAGLVNGSLAVYYPPLDLILMLLQPAVSVVTSSATLYAFNATSGAYLGTWTIAGGATVHAMGVIRDQNGVPTLIMLGGPSSGVTAVGSAGWVWGLKHLSDNSTGHWTDTTETGATVVPTRSATPRIIYHTKQEARFDLVSVVSTSQEAMQLSYVTPRALNTIATSVTPSTSQDGTYRASWGTQAKGREARFTVAAAGTPTSQWGIHAVSAEAIPLGLGPAAP